MSDPKVNNLLNKMASTNDATWFFWNYKLLINGSDLDGWDLGKSVELGYLPDTLGGK